MQKRERMSSSPPDLLCTESARSVHIQAGNNDPRFENVQIQGAYSDQNNQVVILFHLIFWGVIQFA